jgi:hypothetical protein
MANRLRADVLDAEVDLLAIDSLGTYYFQIDLDFRVEEGLSSNPSELLRRLDLLLCQGTLAPASQSAIAGALSSTRTTAVNLARGAILAVLTSPDCAVQE